MASTPKKITISILAIIQFVFAVGQNRNTDKANQIKISPARIIDLVNPGLELGYEKLYAKKYSSQLSVAYMKDFFNATAFDNYKGLRISLEQKLFRLPKKTYRAYYSAELVFLKVNYRDQSSYKKDTASATPKYIDTFTVAKQTLSLNFKYGVQVTIKHITIDVSAGIGIKYKMADRNGIDDLSAYEVTPIDPNAYYIASKGGNHFNINLPLNVKIGFSF